MMAKMVNPKSSFSSLSTTASPSSKLSLPAPLPRRLHCNSLPLRLQTKASAAAPTEGPSEHVSCYTSAEGILILHRLAPGDSKFLVRRNEDEEIDGRGMMVENWFLAGDTSLSYCEVNKEGDLVCSLRKPGVYTVRELMDDGEIHIEHEIECKESEEGELEWNKLR